MNLHPGSTDEDRNGVEAAFSAAIEAAGLWPPEEIIGDGEIHDFNADANGGKKGWYVLHLDAATPHGHFGCLRNGVKESWQGATRPISDVERATIEEQRDAAAGIKAEEREQARKKAEAIVSRLKPAPREFPYLKQKGIQPHGILSLDEPKDALVIPITDPDGAVHSLQYIAPDGKKQFLKHGAKHGHFFMIGQPDGVLAIAEGFATGASVFEATDIATAVAFDAGNLKPTAVALRRKFPRARIIIAGDNDATRVGEKAARAAANTVGGIAVIPPTVGQDWNDVFKVLGAKAVRASFTDLPEPQGLGDLDLLNEKYCVVNDGGKTLVFSFAREEGRDVPIFQTFADFKNFHLNKYVMSGDKRVAVGAAWLRDKARRTYDAVVFDPCRPREFEGKLNLWRGFGIEPKPGEWPLMKNHILEVLADGNEQHRDYILKWAAWAVQNPDKQAEVALVFKGGKGSGKGVFGRTMCDLFGQHGVHISSAQHLIGHFNAHLRDCCLLFADESYWPGDKAAEGTVKRIITEDTLFIEPKGRDGMIVPNRLHVVMASNSDWIVPASDDERRYAVFEVNEQHKQEGAYFTPLYTELGAGGRAAMLFDLLNIDLAEWHPRAVPRTVALREQMMESLNPLDAWWLGLLQDGALPGRKYDDRDPPDRSPSSLPREEGEGLFEHARRTVPYLRTATDHRLGRFLSKQGCTRAWVCEGNRRGWEFPQLSKARKDWAQRFPGAEWDETEEWLPRATPEDEAF